ncbi:MAG TPA: glycosyltransferase [Stellaceae bacterium]|nr:glycosyltransferase [Stellaceae bacterium]
MTLAAFPADSRLASRGATGRVLVQPGRNAFPDMVGFIAEKFGFDLLQLSDYEIHRALSKGAHLRGLIRQSIELIFSLRRLRRCRVVIAIGPISYLIKLLHCLRLVRYETSFCLGWHIRSPRWFPLFRALSRLDGDGDHYIVFSEFEIGLYEANLGIARKRMHFLPYGDWSAESAEDAPETPHGTTTGDYYFAGGYSNRDYPALIAAWRDIPARLVIVCSALNKEIVDSELPANITVLRDLPSAAFEAHVQGARACIIPLKHDAGASGQSVMLRLMRNKKAIVATDFGSVRGYVVNGESGFLVADMAHDLPAIVAQLERNPDAARALGRAAYRRYAQLFSMAAGGEALGRILEPSLMACD